MLDRELELLSHISKLALEKKAINLIAIDLRSMEYIADFFLIATGFNDVHIYAIAHHIVRETKGTLFKVWHKEGLKPGSTWICLDFAEIIMHIMSEKKRKYYDIENLWSDAPRFDLTSIPDLDVRG